MTIGFRGEVQNNFASVNGAVNFRPTFTNALVAYAMIKITKEIHFGLSIPVHAFTAVAMLI